MIYTMMKDMFDYREETKRVISMELLLKRVQAKGFSQEALENTIKHYQKMNVIMVDAEGNIH